MKVTLISYTKDAVDLLIFTKSTRLKMSPNLMDKIKAMTQEEKIEQLTYIANTVPSSWEFVDYTFLVEGVSRAFTHQMVRTRTASYAQQAMRVVDMSDFEYVYTEKNKNDSAVMCRINDCLDNIKDAYRTLLKAGVAIEDARGILPTNIATNIVAKYNLRAFSQLVMSRSGGRVQDEYRNVVKAMVECVLKVHPWAEQFIFSKGKDYFDEIERFAKDNFIGGSYERWELLKIVDKMRRG
jgi:flavin-dependent thymidylate synthase